MGHPRDKPLGLQFQLAGGEEHVVDSLMEPVLSDEFKRPFVVGAVAEHKLHLVMRMKHIKVG